MSPATIVASSMNRICFWLVRVLAKVLLLPAISRPELMPLPPVMVASEKVLPVRVPSRMKRVPVVRIAEAVARASVSVQQQRQC